VSDREGFRHLNAVEEILDGWETGEPIVALCGHSRVVKRENRDDSKNLPTCPYCVRLAEKNGYLINDFTNEEIEARARELRAMPQTSANQWWYTIDVTSVTTVSQQPGEAVLPSPGSTWFAHEDGETSRPYCLARYVGDELELRRASSGGVVRYRTRGAAERAAKRVNGVR